MNDLDNIIFFSLLLKIEKKPFSFRLEIRCHSEKEKKLQTQLSDEAWMKI